MYWQTQMIVVNTFINTSMRKKSRTKSIGHRIGLTGHLVLRTKQLLPLLQDEIATHAMVRHTMDIIKEVQRNLNLDQPLVVTADQPVYALGKKVQWLYPDKHGEDNSVNDGSSSHRDGIVKLIGDWLESSGWVETLVKANISTSVKVSFLKGNHPKRSRYAHQVTCASLEISNDEGNLTDWVDIQKHRSIQWMTLSEAAKSCRERHQLTCMELCKCSGDCTNQP